MTATAAPIEFFIGQYAAFSNFTHYPIAIDGRVYDTAEHAFQALKTDDPTEREWVASAPTPGKAKYRGKRVALRDGWNDGLRDEAMLRVLRAKFEKYIAARERLLATGDAELIEGNRHHDNYWGDCRCGRLPRCAKPGTNRLGQLLMQVREEIR